MSCNNRNVSVGLADDGLALSLRYGMALCSVTFKIKCDIFTLKATQIQSQGNVGKFPYSWNASIQITCSVNVVITDKIIYSCVHMNTCVCLSAGISFPCHQ